MTTRFESPFSASATAAEVIAGIDLSGQRALVTGATSGIGTETVRALASAGAEVTLAVRSEERGEHLAELLRESGAAGGVQVAELDLADLDSVRRCARNWYGPLDILILNAGIMAPPAKEVTRQGFELQFGTNYLGHFALALGFREALSESGRARVVSLSSVGHLRTPILFDDINFDHTDYEPWLAYAQSKTACSLLAVGIAERWATEGISANAVHPGGIRTNLVRYQGDAYYERLTRQYGHVDNAPWKTVEQGASTSVLVATSPLLDGVTGRYFEDNGEAPINGATLASSEALTSGVAPHALSREDASRLWDIADGLVDGPTPN